LIPSPRLRAKGERMKLAVEDLIHLDGRLLGGVHPKWILWENAWRIGNYLWSHPKFKYKPATREGRGK
jgi:hypothetical protein